MSSAPLSAGSQAVFDGLMAQFGITDAEAITRVRALADEGAAATVHRDKTRPPVGASRIGGAPDAPRDWECPHARWGDGARLAFVAQLSFAEMPEIAGVEAPKAGLLSLFADCAAAGWDVEARYSVFRPEQRLVRHRAPAGVQTAAMVDGGQDPDVASHRPFGISVQRALSFDSGRIRYPDTVPLDVPIPGGVALADAFWDRLGARGAEETRLPGAPISRGDDPAANANITHKFMPRLRNMARMSAAAAAGWVEQVREGSDPAVSAYRAAVAGALTAWRQHEAANLTAARKWRPSFQLGSVFDAAMCWNDSGVLRFFIYEDHLAKRQFHWPMASIISS